VPTHTKAVFAQVVTGLERGSPSHKCFTLNPFTQVGWTAE